MMIQMVRSHFLLMHHLFLKILDIISLEHLFHLVFTSLVLGGGTTPIEATFDDLRMYSDCLSTSDIENLYGNGG